MMRFLPVAHKEKWEDIYSDLQSLSSEKTESQVLLFLFYSSSLVCVKRVVSRGGVCGVARTVVVMGLPARRPPPTHYKTL